MFQLKVRSWAFYTNLGYFIFYHSFQNSSKIYFLVANDNLWQIFSCKSDQFLFSISEGGKTKSAKVKKKKFIISISFLNSHLHSYILASRESFVASSQTAQWGPRELADKCSKRCTWEGLKGKSIGRGILIICSPVAQCFPLFINFCCSIFTLEKKVPDPYGKTVLTIICTNHCGLTKVNSQASWNFTCSKSETFLYFLRGAGRRAWV